MAKGELNVENYVYIKLKVEDEDVEKAHNLINTISIHENIMQATPVMQFKFSDFSNELVRKLAVTEATKVKITVSKTNDDAEPREFRTFGFKHNSTREGPRLVGNFILDAPEYITGSYIESYDDKSSEVISQIASKCSLKPDVEKTEDKMIWLNFGQTRAAFAEDISMHGYISESSCMIKALTSTKDLRYKDVYKELNGGDSKKKFMLTGDASSDNDIILVREVRDLSVGGVMNNYMNYGWKYPEHSLKGKEILHKEYKAKSSEKYLPINKDVKDKVKNARLEYCPKLDCRNTHKDYHKAYYINMRGRALLSERIHILIEKPSKVKLLDIVEFSHSEQDQHESKMNGKYIVTAKVIYITNGSRYYEKLELRRAAVREAGKTKLMS